MISILYPNLLPKIKGMPGGILPLVLAEDESPVLVVKAPKEFVLAARINSGFKIYLLPVTVDNKDTFGLVVAFFDDEEQPLIIQTPLFLDDFSKTLFEILQSDELNVHFFDELSRERLACSARVTVPIETMQQIKSMVLLEFTKPRARLMIDGVYTYFGLRTAMDDAKAITILLGESTCGDDLLIHDLRPNNHSYHGSHGFSHTVLEREEPGSYQEEDIVQCLLLVFPPEQIYLNPKRTYDNEEMCDILVVTETYLLIIQAKDSPNIERISRQKLSRKRSNVLSALNKAISQVQGAVSYSRRNKGKIQFLINGELYSINTGGLITKTLIVVKELFNDQFNEYSKQLLGFSRDKKVPCVALGYHELYSYCVHLHDEHAFFNAYNTVVSHAVKEGRYPRLRFGLV